MATLPNSGSSGCLMSQQPEDLRYAALPPHVLNPFYRIHANVYFAFFSGELLFLQIEKFVAQLLCLIPRIVDGMFHATIVPRFDKADNTVNP
jgi:hypothetical protein